MRVLLYWHDIYLPYSQYLIKAFDNNTRIKQLFIVGPKKSISHNIFKQGDSTLYSSNKIKFYRIDSYSINTKYCRLLSFYKIIKENKPDLIIILDEAMSVNVFNAALANKLARNQGRAVFYGFENIYQGIPIKYLKENFSVSSFKTFIRKSFRHFFIDLLIHPIRRKIVYGGLTCYKECSDVILKYRWRPVLKEQWWGIDIGMFKRNIDQNLINRKKKLLKIPPNAKIIGYIGRFIEEKGIIDLLEAIKSLNEDYYLILIGDGSLKDEIVSFIKNNKLEDRIKILSPKQQKDLVLYYKLIDLLVLPSRTGFFWKEQYGRVLVEAIISGTQVIGSDSGAIPFILNDSTRIFKEKDINEIAEKIKQFISKDYKKRNIVFCKTFCEKADVNSFVESFINL